MKEGILLNRILSILGSDITCVDFNKGENSISIRCNRGSDEIEVIQTAILFDGTVIGCDDLPYLKAILKYLKSSNKGLVTVIEERDSLTSKVVSVRLDICSYFNLDCLLLNLTKQIEYYNKVLGVKGVNTYVCDYSINSNLTEIYPLNVYIDCDREETVDLKVRDGKVYCDILYRKYPKLKGVFNEVLLLCISKFLGNYVFSITFCEEVPIVYYLERVV